jgi:quercetin dioxygenase-like cupin family protein
MPRSVKQKRLIAAFAIAAGTMTTIALASPPTNHSASGVVAAELEQSVHLNSERIKFQTKDPVDMSIARLEFGAGGKTGWHHHAGMVLVQVASGTVKVWDSSCAFKTYGPGSVFVEGNAVHEVTSDAGALLYGTAIVEDRDPPEFRTEDPVPFCAQ